MQRNLAKLIRVQRGFTMTELLVVIAITGILLGLLFIPIIQGFNLTRKAQNQVQAQTQSRNGLQQLSRELSQAVFVFDNTTTPVLLPLRFPVNILSGGVATSAYTWANGTVVYPAPVIYSKVDFIPSGRLPSGGTKDPTTGDVIGGSTVRFPLAPGTRVVRYFIGLKDNTRPYENVYLRRMAEFATDGRFNPFVLYRVEFDPSDTKLINPANYNSLIPDAGGFNDPNFFYNYNIAPNGQSYAANWKAIASAVVDGPNQDVVNWVKDDAGDLVLTTPFRPLVSFAPGTVTGDTATPGFMTAAAAEVPNAVPTIYSVQQGHWTLPTSITFYRAASRGGLGSNTDYGALRVMIDSEPLPDGTTRPHIHLDAGATGGTLATIDANLYCARIASTGEIFVKTPNLTFQINMERGTIKTGFPPLAGDNTGVPLIRLADGTVRSMVPGGFPDDNKGELIETIYRLNTRFPTADSDVNTPSNQGWGEINLLNDSTLRYFRADGSDIPLTTPLLTTQSGAYTSPLTVFGNVNAGALQPAGGLMLAAGSESVVGPDMSVTAGTSGLGNVSYYRAPGALTGVLKKSTLITDPLDPALTRKRWTPIVGQRDYIFDQDTRVNGTLPTAILRFDNPGGVGLPARAVTDPANVAERELQVTYLWQNNYARRNGTVDNGRAVDAQGNILGEKSIIAPEPDVVKVDYATRDLLTVNVGALVYDSNTRQGTSINLTDKVRVGNTIR